MLLVLILVVLTGSLGALAHDQARSHRQELSVDGEHQRSLQAAIGAVEVARHRLRTDPRWRGGDVECGPRVCRVELAAADVDGWRLLVSVPSPGALQIDATLRPTGGLPRVAGWRESD